LTWSNIIRYYAKSSLTNKIEISLSDYFIPSVVSSKGPCIIMYRVNYNKTSLLDDLSQSYAYSAH